MQTQRPTTAGSRHLVDILLPEELVRNASTPDEFARVVKSYLASNAGQPGAHGVRFRVPDHLKALVATLSDAGNDGGDGPSKDMPDRDFCADGERIAATAGRRANRRGVLRGALGVAVGLLASFGFGKAAPRRAAAVPCDCGPYLTPGNCFGSGCGGWSQHRYWYWVTYDQNCNNACRSVVESHDCC